MITSQSFIIAFLFLIISTRLYHQLESIHWAPNISKGRMTLINCTLILTLLDLFNTRQIIFASSFWCKTEMRTMIENDKSSGTQRSGSCQKWLPRQFSTHEFSSIPWLNLELQRPSPILVFLCDIQLSAQGQSSHPLDVKIVFKVTQKIQKEHSLLQWVRSWLDYYESYIPTMCSHLEVTMHIRGSNVEIISYLLLTVDCDTISCIVNEHNCFVHWCFLVWRQKLSALYLFRGASQGRKISASQERKEGSSF